MSRPFSISVIMPFFNSAPTLPRALEALLRELPTEPGSELICIDNASTDGSAGIVRAVPGVTLLHEARPGAYVSRNRGVVAARGDIIAFTDPDCLVAAGWLHAIAQAFRDAGCLVALGLRRPAPDTGLNRLLGDYEAAKDRRVLSGHEPLKYYGFTNTMAVRRACWEQFGPFDERPRGSDTIFVRRLVDAEGCDAVRFVPGMLISHLEIDSPVTYVKKTFIYGRSLQSYRRAVAAEPLTLRDRLGVFRSATQDQAHGLFRSTALALLLVAGAVAWSAGRFAGWLVRPWEVGRGLSPKSVNSGPTGASGSVTGRS
jgi:glycosyltransferase involved in cell wall biosynthesis